MSARDEAAAAKPTVYLRDWKKAAQKEHDDLIELRIKTAEEDEIVALPNFIDGYGAGLRAGWDAGREELQRRIDAAIRVAEGIRTQSHCGLQYRGVQPSARR